jgi:ribosomal subunit interface protein
MKITFAARHFEASDKLQSFATTELERLSRYFNGSLTGDLILEENGSLKAAEMRLNMVGKILPVRVEGDDFYKIVPKAVDKLEKQLKAQKARLKRRK